jgi:AcrR family transcriptional regulator
MSATDDVNTVDRAVTADPAPAAPVRRTRARKGEGARLRDEILEATEKLLLATGSSRAVSIRAVADAVGITAPSIYRHFPDKQTLIYEVCAQHFEALHAHMQAAIEGIDDPLDALLARGRAYVEFGRAHPEPYRIMFMTAPEDVPLAREEQWFREQPALIETVANVQQCIDEGYFVPEVTDALRVFLGIWARMHGLTSIVVSKPYLPIDDDFVDEYMDQCVRGVLRNPGDPHHPHGAGSGSGNLTR